MATYKIKKGKHRSGIHIRPHFGTKRMAWTVRFDESCTYDIGMPDQLDVNKLCGISHGLHHKDSARFGWTSVGNRIELFAYYYTNGVRSFKSMGVHDIGEDIELYITVSKEFYHMTVQSKSDSIIRKDRTERNVKACKYGYMLYPYFGGNQTAPHDVKMSLKRWTLL